LDTWQPTVEVVPDDIWALVNDRQRARAEKRWAEADRLRQQVQASGYEIEDTPQGPRVKPLLD
jgi:cysteinyl-tRNA synthetase